VRIHRWRDIRGTVAQSLTELLDELNERWEVDQLTDAKLEALERYQDVPLNLRDS
jgi:molybdopterin/thiamine biosynthesis adenylyltransferase